MHKKFDHHEIEQKWQKKWEADGLYAVGKRDAKKEKEYVLVEWPYPSGNLHIGHWHAFAVPDIYVRAHRMQGKQVLFPMGFDAFGLPAENAAIKRNINPREWTESNIEYMKKQLKSMGNAFSWDKTASSTDPEYYKWTQWMFTKFFEEGVAYRGTGTVNWCPSCNTVLANEQVLADDTCERCGAEVEKKEMDEWKMRITNYADRLVDDLEKLNWPEHIKEAQRQWIGRSKGAKISFALSTGDTLEVFTTRPDTIFGATYMVLAPEHPFIEKNRNVILNQEEVDAYVAAAKKKDEQERMNAEREKTGVKLEGITAINPSNGEEISVFVADYVLAGYGTGAIMAVPAHDERDYEFAKKFELPIRQVILACKQDESNPPRKGLPETERDMISVFLRDKSTGKWGLLKWHGELEGACTGILGGIEDGMTPEEAVLTEIREETGIQDARIIKQLEWITTDQYCAAHKGVNRTSTTRWYICEVDDLSSQQEVDQKEKDLHTVEWTETSKVYDALTPASQKRMWSHYLNPQPIVEEGNLINSGKFDGMDSEEAKEAITKHVGGELTNTYRLRDWSVGRQRYWGVPVPIVYDPEGVPYAIPEEHLPWTLPEDVDFRPTGEPPLAKSEELKKRTEEIFGKGWRPEVETMDTFVDSSWYFLRYFDNENDASLSDLQKQKEWMPVDLYFGGAEHTTMHVLYSRFWQKVLFDLGLAAHDEPYVKRINRGLVLGPDGNKMSKSKGNVIDPDEQVERLGADTVKMYLAFMGPYGEVANYPWDMGGIAGIRRFLERVYGLSEHVRETESEEVTRLLHKTIKKVSDDIDAYKFNTAMSALMIFLNTAEKSGLTQETYETFLRLLAPFAPHLIEELWSVDHGDSVHKEAWPQADETLLKDESVTIAVQVNGKTKGTVTISPDADEEVALACVEADEALAERINMEAVKKVVYVRGRILNFVI